MRFATIFVMALNLAGICHCSGESPDSATIELAILWRSPIDPLSWEPVELAKLLRDPAKFTPEGHHFYKPKTPISVFGYEALYVGAVGMGDVAGPNVMLKAKPEEIANYIREKYNVKFVQKGDAYQGDIRDGAIGEGDAYRVKIRDHVTLIIGPHPEKAGESVVIGAYSGP